MAKDALLVSDGRAAYGQFADAANILHIAINASEGRHTFGTYHIQNVNAYTSRLKEWMRRFKGVASAYLESYLGWRRMIEREGDRITPRQCIAAALKTDQSRGSYGEFDALHPQVFVLRRRKTILDYAADADV